ncbi:hypothetical protein BRD00_00455 [Halobacteriales archaeon QS_8_69_26]|nr:MAG: hypothetical protein BRD00_00455 [Halobacteriales archaeon QS_8_69_26]
MSGVARSPVERVLATCGRQPRRRRVGGVVLAGLTVLVLGGTWVPHLLVTGPGTWHRVETVDGVVAAAVLAVVASVGLGFVYAVWNGGPLLSFAIPVLPELVGRLSAGSWAVDQDLAVVLSAGAGAAVLAVYGTAWAERDSPRADRYGGVVDGLTVATPAVVLALGALVRLRGRTSPHVADAVGAAWILWGLTAVAATAAWVGCLRAAVGTTESPGDCESDPGSGT